MNALTALYQTNKQAFLEVRRVYQRRVRTFPATLEPIPKDEFDALVADKSNMNPPRKAWRSREFLVQLFKERTHYRLSINRTEIDSEGRWKDGITWDQLMECKRQCGFGDHWAVEVYPVDSHLVNVAPIRHLWLVKQPPYAWTKL